MKVFSRTHFWKDHRTFIEIEAKEAERDERGYPKEGSLIVKIGEQSNIKCAFKLSVDEARGLRDNLDSFIKSDDAKMSGLMSDEQPSFVEPAMPPEPEKPAEPFFMFSSDEQEEKKEPEEQFVEKKKRTEFYF